MASLVLPPLLLELPSLQWHLKPTLRPMVAWLLVIKILIMQWHLNILLKMHLLQVNLQFWVVTLSKKLTFHHTAIWLLISTLLGM